MIKKIKKIFNTDVKLISSLLVALVLDFIFLILAYKNNYTAIVASVFLIIILLFLIIKIIVSFQLKNIEHNFIYNDIQIVMSLLFKHLNETNDKYLYVSKKLYNILPIVNNYFYFDNMYVSKHKIKVLVDDTLKNLEFKTNNKSPYINSINDINI